MVICEGAAAGKAARKNTTAWWTTDTNRTLRITALPIYPKKIRAANHAGLAHLKGKPEAAREFGDRTEGKARQPVEVSGGPIGYAEIVARIRKRKAEAEANDRGAGERKVKP